MRAGKLLDQDAPHTAEIIVLDVGHGNACLVRDTENCLIIDCGPNSFLSNYLCTEGIADVDAVYVSHSHRDHFRGLLWLLESCPEIRIQRIIINPSQCRENKDLWDSLCAELDQLENTILDTSLNRTMPTAKYGEFSVEVLSPPAGAVLSKDAPNRNSGILSLFHHDTSVALFPADSDGTAWAALRKRGVDCRSPILVYPHHGGHSDIRDDSEFAALVLDSVQPELVIVSNGRGRWDNPLPEVVMQCSTRGSQVACTQLSRRCSPIEYLGRRPEFRSLGATSGACCAGTIRIGLPLTSSYGLDDHRNFLNTLVQHGDEPLCLRAIP